MSPLNIFRKWILTMVVLTITWSVTARLTPETTASYLEIGPRIISAKPTTIAKHPHLMRVVGEGSNPIKPGRRTSAHGQGALLTDKWVLTAAHVVNPALYDQVMVIGGMQHSHLPAGYMQFQDACKVVVHPQYKKSSESRPSLNDVALVQLCQPMIPSQWVRPLGVDAIPSWSGDKIFDKFKVCVIAGLGAVDFKYTEPDVLQEAQLRLLGPTSKCRDLGYVTDPIDPNLCTYGEYQLAAPGDSGTPLMCNGKLLGVMAGGPYNSTVPIPKNQRVNVSVRMDYWYQWVYNTIYRS